MDIKSYLRRIGCDGAVRSDADTLRALHLAHMYSVPFENLDISRGVPIVLDLEMVFDKIVNRRRGGFCYELNGLFHWLLTELGFEAVMLSASVVGEDGIRGPEFDHMLLRVGKEFIADVGFGDSFVEPMRFDETIQTQSSGEFRFTCEGDEWILEQNRGAGFLPQYVFTETERELHEFEEMCHYQQTSPDSIFTKKTMCSMALPGGRVSIANGRLIETLDGTRSERPLAGDKEISAGLKEKFGVELE